jgi:hypothetical protein
LATPRQHLYWGFCFILKCESQENHGLRKIGLNVYKSPNLSCQLQTCPRTRTQRKDFTAVISLVFVIDLLHKALLDVLRDFSASKYLLSSQFIDLSLETLYTWNILMAPRMFSFKIAVILGQSFAKCEP